MSYNWTGRNRERGKLSRDIYIDSVNMNHYRVMDTGGVNALTTLNLIKDNEWQSKIFRAMWSELIFFAFWKLHLGSVHQLLVHVGDLILVNRDLRRLEDRGLHKGQVGVTKGSLIDLILTRRVGGEARWRAFQTDSCSWQRYHSTEGSSFCGR